jgi:crotonobetainyl-CoA:carnitine CoA-transferase CaiB-like acyl-CoA transferase
MVAADPKKIWADLSRRFGLVDGLAPGADVATKSAARAEVVAAWFRSFPSRAELIDALEGAGLAWGDVRRPAEVADSPSVQARNLLVDVDDRAGGRRRVVQSPYRFSAARAGLRGPAPYRGEHNGAVLGDWLDLPDAGDVLAKLAAAGAIDSELPAPQEARDHGLQA